jgi:hypothetical protein
MAKEKQHRAYMAYVQKAKAAALREITKDYKSPEYLEAYKRHMAIEKEKFQPHAAVSQAGRPQTAGGTPPTPASLPIIKAVE